MFISIHALREEGDTARKTKSINLSQFQSTPSARRATESRSAEGGITSISIHALREEGDLATLPVCTVKITFQSTPSARRAT